MHLETCRGEPGQLPLAIVSSSRGYDAGKLVGAGRSGDAGVGVYFRCVCAVSRPVCSEIARTGYMKLRFSGSEGVQLFLFVVPRLRAKNTSFLKFLVIVPLPTLCSLSLVSSAQDPFIASSLATVTAKPLFFSRLALAL